MALAVFARKVRHRGSNPQPSIQNHEHMWVHSRLKRRSELAITPRRTAFVAPATTQPDGIMTESRAEIALKRLKDVKSRCSCIPDISNLYVAHHVNVRPCIIFIGNSRGPSCRR